MTYASVCSGIEAEAEADGGAEGGAGMTALGRVLGRRIDEATKAGKEAKE